jgi:hypothetical protein
MGETKPPGLQPDSFTDQAAEDREFEQMLE